MSIAATIGSNKTNSESQTGNLEGMKLCVTNIITMMSVVGRLRLQIYSP